MALAASIADTSWDFRAADTKQDTHCYHNYPAMMIPQVARRLIECCGKNAATLFDPYCGTGTSLVEARISGLSAHGADLNPMARLIAETKTLAIEPQVLTLYLKEFNEHVFALNFDGRPRRPAPPDFANIDFWFKPETAEKLAALKQFILSIQHEPARKFFLVAFSETVRESSLTRNSEFKLYRMPAAQRESFCPDVYAMMTAKLARNRAGLLSYLNKIRNTNCRTVVHDADSTAEITGIEKNTIDLVVTSPPYGDSKTTVAYGQFSRLSNQWLDIDHAAQIDNLLMGGKPKAIEKTGIAPLDAAVKKIAAVDEKRAREVYGFYADYRQSIKNVAATIRRGGCACYVVGNRRVKGTELRTDEITRALFERNGFRHQHTHVRSIPNKRMPSRNSPSNIAGQTASTMNTEHIVIMRKQ